MLQLLVQSGPGHVEILQHGEMLQHCEMSSLGKSLAACLNITDKYRTSVLPQSIVLDYIILLHADTKHFVQSVTGHKVTLSFV